MENIRIPPFNKDAEDAIIGAILIDPEILNQYAHLIAPDHFYDMRNRLVVTALRSQAMAGDAVDIITVCDRLREQGQLERAGGASYITRLASTVPSSANFPTYLESVKADWLRRRFIQVGTQLVDKGFGHSPTKETIATLEAFLQEATRNIELKKSVHIAEMLAVVAKEIEETKESGGALTGIPTGYGDIDRMTGGFQKTDLIIIAARPSVGKTSLALNLAVNMGLNGVKVGFVTIEMSDRQLVYRVLGSESGVSSQFLRTGRFFDRDWVDIVHAQAKLAKCDIQILDVIGASFIEVRSRIREMVRHHGCEIIFVDYMQKIQTYADTDHANASREQTVSKISNGFKQIAKEMNIPVVALAQVKRDVEKKGRPGLADLRESGAIEQDADVVAFLFPDGETTERSVPVTLAFEKHRNGPTGDVNLVFLKDTTRFVPAATRWEPGEEASEE